MVYFSRRWRGNATAAAFLPFVMLVLANCSGMPGQGATKIEVVSHSQSAPTDEREGYIVITLDQRVIQLLQTKASPSFVGHFGDYRPVPKQTIGVGDTMAVTIWESAPGGLFSSPVNERSSPGSQTAVIPEQVVAQDGSITVPYAGRIKVVGLTLPMVEQKIIEALAGKAIDPQALVTITKNASNTVTVAGEVVQGARVPISPRGDRILDVLASAGGVRSPVYESFVILSRDGKSVAVPLQILMGDARENIYVRPNDTLMVEKVPQSFTAFGATGRNSVINFDGAGITLEEAIAKAGGLLEFQSDPEGVFVLRMEPVWLARQIDPDFPIPPGKDLIEVVYQVNLRDTNSYFMARRFRMQNKDMLYIANAPLTNVQKIMTIVAPVAGTAATAITIAQ